MPLSADPEFTMSADTAAQAADVCCELSTVQRRDRRADAGNVRGGPTRVRWEPLSRSAAQPQPTPISCGRSELDAALLWDNVCVQQRLQDAQLQQPSRQPPVLGMAATASRCASSDYLRVGRALPSLGDNRDQRREDPSGRRQVDRGLASEL